MKKIICVICIIFLLGFESPKCVADEDGKVINYSGSDLLLNGLNQRLIVMECINYNEVAGRIVDYYGSKGKVKSWEQTRRIVKAAEKAANEYFPHREIDAIDILTIIMIESNFNHDARGRHKEAGLMQIKDWRTWLHEINGIYDPYNIECNIDMGVRLLKDKIRHHSDKKKSIIAYNGLVYKKGKLIEKYWKKFILYRSILENYVNSSKYKVAL